MKPDDFGFISGFVPSLFESYVAIRHPAWLHNCTKENLHECQGDPAPGTSITWSEVVDSDLPICMSHTQYRKLENIGWIKDELPYGVMPVLIQVGDRWISHPTEGVLEPEQAHTLLPLLTQETSEPTNCWFGIWDGFSIKSIEERNAPMFHTPNRSWYVFQGPLQSIAKSFNDSALFHQPANFIWPDDRSWCLASDIDSEATYLGGSEKLIALVLANKRLDAISVVPSDRPLWLANLLQPVVEKLADTPVKPGFESRVIPFMDQIREIDRRRRFRRFIESIRLRSEENRDEDRERI
ncbi:MAG: hypothetical protein OXG05_07990 [Gammaproteobacteria bacterium]|nr:hypothetical protein [Gammaproteobacteria bacterium]